MRFFNLLIIVLISSMLMPIPVQSQRSLLQEEFNNPDFSTPTNIETHVFNFFHHSCGWYLLDDGLAAGLEALGYTLHSQIMTSYQY